MKFSDEEKIEKEILKKIEKKSNKRDEEMKEEEIETESEYLIRPTIQTTEENNIKAHFDKINSAELKKLAENKKLSRFDLYNEKFGNYKFQIANLQHKFNPNIPINSKISKYLISNDESLKNIINTEFKSKVKKIELSTPDYFNLKMFKYLDNYSDLYFTSSDLMLRHKLMNVYIFHILNHVLKRKEEIEINNRIEKLIERHQNKTELNLLKEELFLNEDEEFLKKYYKSNDVISVGESFEEFKVKSQKENFLDFNLKDQGFTSPRVLILVPNKKHARLIIEEMVSILRQGQWKGISNKKKFKEEYSETDSLNDCFRLGISFDFFNNKLRLYQPFDNSDIIVASPLGLKLTHQNNDSDPSVKNKKVYDFLSSIEILLMDFSEVFLYQNTEHLEEILSFLNKQPKNNQNINSIVRIKENVKDDCLQYLRQNIVISHFKSLEIEMLVKKYCNNLIGGAYVLQEKYENLIDIIKSSKNSKNLAAENEEKNLDENRSVISEDPEEDLQIDIKTGIKFEFKMMKVFDAMDLYDHKFNFFTKNVRNINHYPIIY